jgi:lipopolysaccharide export system protein LptA
MRLAARFLAFAALLALLPADLGAQERECTIATRDPAGRTVREPGSDVYLMHDPFTVICEDGAQLRANSGRYDASIGEVYLVGEVYFEDGDRVLTSNEATYQVEIARLHARGEVVFVDRAEGSTLRGPDLEYFQATEERPLTQMIATLRPTLTLTSRDTMRGADSVADPLELVADRVTMIGEDDLTAIGDVVITRSDFRATSGEARYNTATEDLELRENALIIGDEFELTGEVVQTRVADGEIEYLHSRTNASLRGEEIDVEGSDLQLYFRESLLQRAIARVARGEADRAIARSSTFRIEADSLDATFVDERIEQVVAVGSAFALTMDTTDTASSAPATPGDEEFGDEPAAEGSEETVFESDWIRGDTIVGYFEPRPPTEPDPLDATPLESAVEPVEPVEDARPEVELRRLVARGAAQSLYRVASENAANGDTKNLNFLVGAVIELDLADGELQVAHVEGLQVGVYLEADPVPATDGAGADDANEAADPADSGATDVDAPDADVDAPASTPGGV